MKRRLSASFVVVIPASMLLGCAGKNGNGTTTPEGFPPNTYSGRIEENGACHVRMSANPPANLPVSCTAPIEPTGNGGCEVASAGDPATKIPVACTEDKP